MSTTKYFLDCEFCESGPEHPIELISIGIVSSDGREYYAQSVEFDEDRVNDWVEENVLPHLLFCPCSKGKINHEGHGKCRHELCPWRTRAQMVTDILAFMDIGKYGEPEIWTYFGAYDFVLFSQLFGTMVDLPKGFPMLAYDLRQWLDMNELSEIHQPNDPVHHALRDAKWIAEMYKRFHIDTNF